MERSVEYSLGRVKAARSEELEGRRDLQADLEDAQFRGKGKER